MTDDISRLLENLKATAAKNMPDLLGMAPSEDSPAELAGDDPGPLLTPDEVAAELKVNRRTVYRLLELGELIGFRVAAPGSALRITAKSLQNFIRRKISEYQLENGLSLDSRD